MKPYKFFFLIILLIFTVLIPIMIFAGTEYSKDINKDGNIDEWYVIGANGNIEQISTDRNYDGKVDNILTYDEYSNKKYEELDFNFDGIMDDYYFYEAGILIRREIDSNYDLKVDMWVYIEEGKYMIKKKI